MKSVYLGMYICEVDFYICFNPYAAGGSFYQYKMIQKPVKGLMLIFVLKFIALH